MLQPRLDLLRQRFKATDGMVGVALLYKVWLGIKQKHRHISLANDQVHPAFYRPRTAKTTSCIGFFRDKGKDVKEE